MLDRKDQSATKWKKYMSQTAARLQMFLFRCVDDYGECPVCLNAYGNSIEDHIMSRKHCEAVRKTAQNYGTRISYNCENEAEALSNVW